MTTSEPPVEPTNKRQHPAIPMLLAVIGSVAGTLVTSAFSSSQNLALFGAALGAAVPPLIAVAGPFTHLRLGAGVLIAAMALLLTYGGFTARDNALGVEEKTFPPVPGTKSTGTETSRPKTTPPTRPTPSSSASPSPGASFEGQLCINWWPRRLHCSTDPCDPNVTVASEGNEVLIVTGLKFTGEAASRLSQQGTCEGEVDQDEPCSITVRVKPGAAGRAQLRIQQNLDGPASLVDIEVDALSTTSSPLADLDLSLFTLPECGVVPGGALSGADNLTIFVAVRNSGPTQLSQLATFTIASDTGLIGGGNAAVSTGSSFAAMQVDLRPDDYGRSHRFTVTVDPNNDIAERDESNNTLRVTVSLPGPPNNAQDVPCTTP